MVALCEGILEETKARYAKLKWKFATRETELLNILSTMKKGSLNLRGEIMEFKVGDICEAFGLKCFVIDINIKHNYPVKVSFEGGHCRNFLMNGKFEDWQLEPSLKLIERPKKKVKKKFYLGHDKYSPIHSYIGCGALWITRKDAEVQKWEHVLEVEIEVDEE